VRTYKFTGLCIGFFLLIACNEQVKKDQLVHLIGQTQGTTYSIKYFHTDTRDYQPEVDSIFHEVDFSMSTYIDGSIISKINKGNRRVKVDTLFKEVFITSQEIWKQTDSVFDPTVGALVNAWGFGPEGKITLDSLKIDSIRAFTGLEKVFLNENNYFSKTDKRTQLDFNAIAQGYSVDLVARFLNSKNIENYLVEIGGEIRAKGKNLSNNFDWLVAIDNPLQKENRSFIATLKLKNMALATSGNYRKFYIDSLTGEKYVHTIDPKTGYPKKSNVLSASVLAAECMVADGYATAIMAMDLEKSKVLLDSLSTQIDAFIIYLDDNNKLQKYITPGFKPYLIE
jgi:thiamine biosynthesis lipoprotein